MYLIIKKVKYKNNIIYILVNNAKKKKEEKNTSSRGGNVWRWCGNTGEINLFIIINSWKKKKKKNNLYGAKMTCLASFWPVLVIANYPIPLKHKQSIVSCYIHKGKKKPYLGPKWRVLRRLGPLSSPQPSIGPSVPL